ncbi:hypothetical protein GCM10027051_02330 [Niabella terrae]
MNKTIAKYFYIWLFYTCCTLSANAQDNNILRGVVEDAEGIGLHFATVRLIVEGAEVASRTTDTEGRFEFNTNLEEYDSIQLEATFVNKAPQSVLIHRSEYSHIHNITLLPLSLTLSDVVVSGVVKNQNSASSIVFDEEAIRQLQAFSLMDVLNALPGRKTTAPDLQTPQTISLRTGASGVDAMNNSFGVAIFIDGVRISNETNMQSRGISSRGLGGSLLNGFGESTADVTYNGFDLRDIPMSNIASIEIIQGVGSAKYGDFNNGAILITTKAGRTPYNFNSNFNGGSTSFSLAKGYDLGPNVGALNFGIGYTNSNKDPRDKVKSYNNVNASLKWTKDFSKIIRNSLNISAESNLDDKKADPDDDADRMSYSKRRNLRLSNNTTFTFNKRFLDNAAVLLSYSTGRQDSYTQWLLNGMPKGIASKDTTGVYEGYFVPGNYLAVEQIEGRPVSYSAQLDLQSKLIPTLSLQHQFSAGLNLSGAGNTGRGNIVDPDHPRWVDQSDQNERSFSYADSVKFETNFGLYFQDNIRGKLFRKRFNFGIGFRLNVQNQNLNPQPRISFNYALNKNWSISSSYGISFKSPSLAHLYPAPTYFDLPLLNLYTGYTNTSLYLVYTKMIPAENRALKNAATYQFEQGITFRSSKIGSGSMFAYYKKNKNGFNTFTEYIPTEVPLYNYTLNPDSTISYFPTGETATAWDLRRSRMNNGLNSEDWGLQFSFQSKYIPVILTSLAIRAGYAVSRYTGGNLSEIVIPSESALAKGVRYVEYPSRQRVSRESVLNFTTSTHIPTIGFIISVVADYQPLLQQRWEAENIYPLSYTMYTGEQIQLSRQEAESEELAYLRKGIDEDTGERLTIPSRGFWTFNMRVAKEIGKRIRLSVSAFNVLNIKPKAYTISNKDGNQTVGIYNYNPLSITMGASLQL